VRKRMKSAYTCENRIITLSLLFIEVFRCVRFLHPPSASFIRVESLTALFLTCADRSGWQIIPTRILILIEINHKITEYVCKNPHLYNLCLSQYNEYMGF